MTLAIIGSRNCGNIDISPYVPENVKTIVSGGAQGVDTLAANYAKEHGIELIEYRPDYKTGGRGATFIRNRKIVDSADMILAFWNGGSKGTKYTIDYAKKHNKPTEIVII